MGLTPLVEVIILFAKTRTKDNNLKLVLLVENYKHYPKVRRTINKGNKQRTTISKTICLLKFTNNNKKLGEKFTKK